MLAIARAMMLEPKIILLDEPTEGLMPRMVSQIREIVDMLHQRGRGHPARRAERGAHADGERAASTSWRRAWCATRRRPPPCARIRPSSISTWECERGHSRRSDPRADGQRARQRHDPRAGRLRTHADLRHHGRRQLRPRRPRDAGRLRGRGHHRRHRQLLGRPPRGGPRGRGVRRRAADHHAAARCSAAIRSPPSWPPSACRWCCRSTRCGSGDPRPAISRSRSPAASTSSTFSTRGTGSPPRSSPAP